MDIKEALEEVAAELIRPLAPDIEMAIGWAFKRLAEKLAEKEYNSDEEIS